MGNAVVRGILVGAAVGVFAVLLGLYDDMFRAVGLGMIMGALAGLTLSRRGRRR